MIISAVGQTPDLRFCLKDLCRYGRERLVVDKYMAAILYLCRGDGDRSCLIDRTCGWKKAAVSIVLSDRKPYAEWSLRTAKHEG
jgi:hypothetical protein